MIEFDSPLKYVVLQSMLDSYIGTLDHRGLKSLQTEFDQPRPLFDNRIGRFWAVLDRSLVPTINLAIAKGDSRSALRIVLQQARDYGGI